MGRSWNVRTSASLPLRGGQFPGMFLTVFQNMPRRIEPQSPTCSLAQPLLACVPSMLISSQINDWHPHLYCLTLKRIKSRVCQEPGCWSERHKRGQSKPGPGAQSHRMTVPTIEKAGKSAPSEMWHSLWQCASAL